MENVSITELISIQPDINTITTIQASDRRSEQILDSAYKAQKGTDLHRYFEALKYNSLEDLTVYLNANESKALSWLIQQKQIPLRDILNHGYVEMGFGLKLNEQFIQGQIDAWGVVNNEVYIIDYKTGSTKYAEKAFKQLQFYAICLKNMMHIKSNQMVHLVVLYPFDESIKIKTINENTIGMELSI